MIKISGAPAPRTQGFLWFRRPLDSTCLSPCDSHTRLPEQTGLSRSATLLAPRPHPAASRPHPGSLPPCLRMLTFPPGPHHGSYPVLLRPPLPEKVQPQTSCRSPGPPTLPSSPGTPWPPAGLPTALANKHDAQPGLVARLCWGRVGGSPRHPGISRRRLRRDRRPAAEADGEGLSKPR